MKYILILTNFKNPFDIQCDGSGKTIRAILTNDGKLVVYLSEKWNKEKKVFYL